eukprot:m.350710 g.350710  ORF g.350710 m.350710 type:complete len:266 (+) comp16159_c0_seq2:1419-2216(+)
MDAPEPEHVSSGQFINQDVTNTPVKFTEEGLKFLRSFSPAQLGEVVKSLGMNGIKANADSIIQYLCTANNVLTLKAQRAQLSPTFVKELNKKRFAETERWRKVLTKLQPIQDQSLWPKMSMAQLREYFKDDGSTRQGYEGPRRVVSLKVLCIPDQEGYIYLHGDALSSVHTRPQREVVARLRYKDGEVVEVEEAMVLYNHRDKTPTRDAYHSVHVFGLLFNYVSATQPSPAGDDNGAFHKQSTVQTAKSTRNTPRLCVEKGYCKN